MLFCGTGIRTCTSSPATRTRTELHPVGHDLRAIHLLTFFLPTPRLHPAFDENRRTLLQILVHGICLAAEDDDVVEIGLFLLLAVAILESTIGRDGEIDDVHAAWQRTQFRIPREITVKQGFIQVHTSSIPIPRSKSQVLSQVRLRRPEPLLHPPEPCAGKI